MKTRPEKLLNDFNASTLSDWQALCEKSLNGKGISDIKTQDYNQITIEPIYSAENSLKLNKISSFLPGEFPFRRGLNHFNHQASFNICQEITNRNPNDYNLQLKSNLASGQNSIYASLISHAELNDIHHIGTLITNAEDIERMFDGIDLCGKLLYVSVSASSISLLLLFKEFILSKGLNRDVSCNICLDPIEELIETGRDIFDNKEIFKWLLNEFPKADFQDFRVSFVSGYSFSDRGGSSVQEVAYAFSQAVDYIYELLDNGFEINHAASTFHFSFAINSNFFEEIAKFRALRVVWANLLHQLGADDINKKISFRAITARSNKSSLDKETNILRTTTEALSAVLSDCETITVHTFNEFSEPDDAFAHRVAKNIQIVLREECNLQNPTDPAGGSWYSESLTNDMIEKIWELMGNLDAEGGFFESLKKGLIQKSISDVSNERYLRSALRKSTMIGVNKYSNQKDGDILKHRSCIDAPIDKDHDTLNSEMIIPPGKLLIQKLEKFRADKKFFELRKNSANYMGATGKQPEIFTCSLGPVKQHKARVDFARDYFSIGGIVISYNGKEYLNIDEVRQDYLSSGLDFLVICSSDDLYKELGVELIKTIKESKSDTTIILAGNPPELIDELFEAGLDLNIHIKSNVVEVLEEIQKRMKIKDKK